MSQIRTEQVVVENGKYTIQVIEGPSLWKFHALRHGQPWRNLVGDGLVLAMFYRIQELEQQILKFEALKANPTT